MITQQHSVTIIVIVVSQHRTELYACSPIMHSARKKMLAAASGNRSPIMHSALKKMLAAASGNPPANQAKKENKKVKR